MSVRYSATVNVFGMGSSFSEVLCDGWRQVAEGNVQLVEIDEVKIVRIQPPVDDQRQTAIGRPAAHFDPVVFSKANPSDDGQPAARVQLPVASRAMVHDPVLLEADNATRGGVLHIPMVHHRRAEDECLLLVKVFREILTSSPHLLEQPPLYGSESTNGAHTASFCRGR